MVNKKNRNKKKTTTSDKKSDSNVILDDSNSSIDTSNENLQIKVDSTESSNTITTNSDTNVILDKNEQKEIIEKKDETIDSAEITDDKSTISYPDEATLLQSINSSSYSNINNNGTIDLSTLSDSAILKNSELEEHDDLTVKQQQQQSVMKDLLDFLNLYKSTTLDNVETPESNESSSWKSLYFAVSKQLNLERTKTETLEKIVLEKDQEVQTLKDQIKLMELEIVNERKKFNKTVGTIRNGTKMLTVKLGNNVDVQTILEELNANVDQTISTSTTITENLASIMNGSNVSSDQLLTRLNTLKSSVSNSSMNLLSSSKNSTLNYSPDEVKKIIIVQSLVKRWSTKKIYKKLINELETKRSIIAELFETERTYVSRIKDLLKIFVNPLKQRVKNDAILQQEEIDNIFSSISMIYKCNTIFLDRIEEIYLKFNRWSCFGDKILEQIPLFECYIDYIINFEFATKSLKKLLHSSKPLQEFVKSAENKPELDDLDIFDLMIMPVQRIPRYIMLFKEVKKVTPIHHKDYHSLDKTLEAFKHFAHSVNEKSGARKKVLQLEDRIIGYKDDITSNSRYLVREGTLKYKKNNEYVFLFNDMIVICHPTLKKTKSKTLSTLPTISTNNSSSSNLTGSTSSTTSSSGLSSPTSPNSSPNLSRHHDNPETETIFKFVSKITLDSRVKIVQDAQEPKFFVIIPDDSRVEFSASSNEERLLWIQDIMMIVSVFSSHNLIQPIILTNNVDTDKL